VLNARNLKQKLGARISPDVLLLVGHRLSNQDDGTNRSRTDTRGRKRGCGNGTQHESPRCWGYAEQCKSGDREVLVADLGITDQAVFVCDLDRAVGIAARPGNVETLRTVHDADVVLISPGERWWNGEVLRERSNLGPTRAEHCVRAGAQIKRRRIRAEVATEFSGIDIGPSELLRAVRTGDGNGRAGVQGRKEYINDKPWERRIPSASAHRQRIRIAVAS
jgi:hypothetical protein